MSPPHPSGADAPPPSRPYAVLAAVLPATYVQLVDVSIVNLAVPAIQRDLDASYAAIQLILAGYQLAFACTLITAARLGDRFGRRRMFLLGMVGFALTSAACGAAPSAGFLVATRIVQGVMSGLMFPQVLSVIQVTFPRGRRGRAFGIYGGVVALATIVGPLLGGALITLDLYGLGWRLIFYANLPVAALAIAAAIRSLPESTVPDARRLDLGGTVLVTGGLFLLLFPLTEGRERGWPWWITPSVAAAAVLLTAFWFHQRDKTARDDAPLVYTTLFRHRIFRRGMVLAFVLFLGVPSFFFVLMLFLQLGQGFTPLEAGLINLPFAVGSGITSIASDRLVRRWGRPVLQVGAVILAAGTAAIAALAGALPHDLSAWHLLAPLFVAGLGLGLVLAPMITLILRRADGQETGSAAGVLTTGQEVGGALGIALVGALFFALLGPAAPETMDASGASPGRARQAAFSAAYARTLLVHLGVFAAFAVILHLIPRHPRRTA